MGRVKFFLIQELSSTRRFSHDKSYESPTGAAFGGEGIIPSGGSARRRGDLARHAAIHRALGGHRVRLAEDDERRLLQKAEIQLSSSFHLNQW